MWDQLHIWYHCHTLHRVVLLSPMYSIVSPILCFHKVSWSAIVLLTCNAKLCNDADF